MTTNRALNGDRLVDLRDLLCLSQAATVAQTSEFPPVGSLICEYSPTGPEWLSVVPFGAGQNPPCPWRLRLDNRSPRGLSQSV